MFKMRFLVSFLFLVSVFCAQAVDDFVRDCERDGTINIAKAYKIRLENPLAEISLSLSKTFTLCLEVAVKYRGCKNKNELDRIRKAIQCHLKSCVDETYGDSIIGDASLKLSTSFNTFQLKTDCNVLSEYKKGSLTSDVLASREVSATLDKTTIQHGPLGDLLAKVQGLLKVVVGILGGLVKTLGLDDLLGGLIASVGCLLDDLLCALENVVDGKTSSSSSSSSSSNSQVSRTEITKQEILNVYSCNLGDGSYKKYTSCGELSIGIDGLVDCIKSLKGRFDMCLNKKFDEMVENPEVVLRKICS